MSKVNKRRLSIVVGMILGLAVGVTILLGLSMICKAGTDLEPTELEIADWSFDQHPSEGDLVEFFLNITNKGDVDIESNFTINMSIDTTDGWIEFFEYDAYNTPIEAGSYSEDVIMWMSMPGDSGDRKISIWLDQEDNTTDDNTDNNNITFNFVLYPPGPDPVVCEYFMGEPYNITDPFKPICSPQANHAMITPYIDNYGNENGDIFITYYYQKGASKEEVFKNPDVGTLLIGTNLNYIAPEWWGFWEVNETDKGMGKIIIEIECANDVNESNNIMEFPVEVIYGIDPTITDINIDNANPKEEETTNITVNVTNNGTVNITQELELFSLDPDYYGEYLKEGLVDDELKLIFSDSKHELSDGAYMTQINTVNWEIQDENNLYRIENITTDLIVYKEFDDLVEVVCYYNTKQIGKQHIRDLNSYVWGPEVSVVFKWTPLVGDAGDGEIWAEVWHTKEDNYDNNESSKIDVTVKAGLPDFRITDGSQNKNAVEVDESVELSATVTNSGSNWDASIPGDEIKVEFYADNANTPVQEKIPLGSTNINTPFNNGDTEDVKLDYICNLDQGEEYYILAIIDPNKVIEEENEDNNEFNISEEISEKLMVVVVLPNLIFSPREITLNYDSKEEGDPHRGEKIEIEVTIKNEGKDIDINFDVQFLMNDIEINSVPINSLGEGDTEDFTFEWYAMDIGPQQIKVVIDPDNDIVESNELDNDITKDIEVQDTLCKLNIKELKVDILKPKIGDEIKISTIIENEVSTQYDNVYLPAVNVIVRFYNNENLIEEITISEIKHGDSEPTSTTWTVEESYSFILDSTYKQYLIEGDVANDLKDAFKTKLITLNSTAKLLKIDEKHWEIEDDNGKKRYRIEDTDKQLEIYEEGFTKIWVRISSEYLTFFPESIRSSSIKVELDVEPTFEITKIEIPNKINEEDKLNITVFVKNNGTCYGYAQVKVFIDDEEKSTEDIGISRGQIIEINFTEIWEAIEVKQHSIEIKVFWNNTSHDKLSTTITVDAGPTDIEKNVKIESISISPEFPEEKEKITITANLDITGEIKEEDLKVIFEYKEDEGVWKSIGEASVKDKKAVIEHTFDKKGSYIIRAKIKDSTNVSKEKKIEVTEPVGDREDGGNKTVLIIIIVVVVAVIGVGAFVLMRGGTPPIPPGQPPMTPGQQRPPVTPGQQPQVKQVKIPKKPM